MGDQNAKFYPTSRVSNGQQRVQTAPPQTRKDAKTDGPASRYFFKSCAQLRAGVAIGACLRREADVFSDLRLKRKIQRQKTLLGYKKLLCATKADVSGLGV